MFKYECAQRASKPTYQKFSLFKEYRILKKKYIAAIKLCIFDEHCTIKITKQRLHWPFRCLLLRPALFLVNGNT